MDANQYCALLIDVKNSRSYPKAERNGLQHLMVYSLEYLNRLFACGIEKNVMFSAGDEVQGLFRSPAAAFLLYRFMSLLMQPGTIRGGMGIGHWDVRVQGENTTFQDGEAYHRARNAISFAKASRHYDLILESFSDCDTLITVMFDHSASICQMRTSKQNETALAVELLTPLMFKQKSNAGLSEPDFSLLKKIVLARREAFPSKSENRDLLERLFCTVSDGNKRSAKAVFPDHISLQDEKMDAFLKGNLTGIAYDIAELSGMTRQGIDQQLSRGRINQERNAAKTVADFLSETFEGGR